jgi:ribose transport system substrate-binding protein
MRAPRSRTRIRLRGRRSRAISITVLCALLVAACGSSSSSSSSSTAAASTGTNASSSSNITAQVAAATQKCSGAEDPLASNYSNPQLQAWLRGTQIVPVVKSIWGNPKISPLKPMPKPWKVGFSNSYAGNAARQAVIQAMEDQTAAYKKAGLVSGLESTLSNENAALHNQQILQLVHSGVAVIVDLSEGANLTTRAIDAAGKSGIPVVTMDAPVDSPYAVNVSTANWLQSVQSAGWMIRQLGGKGTIVTVQGIKGEPGSDIWEQSADCMFQQFPGIKILANIYGDWTESVAKTQMQQVLATNPGAKIDAVWVQGPGTTGVIQAFLQTGRPVPKYMTNVGQQAVLAYWHTHQGQVAMYSASQPPYESTVEAYQVAMRILEGQRPILNTVYSLGPPITDATLGQWYQPSDSFPSSPGFAPISQEEWMPQSLLNDYFYNGSPVLP